MNFDFNDMVGSVHTEQEWAECVRFDTTELPKILIVLSKKGDEKDE